MELGPRLFCCMLWWTIPSSSGLPWQRGSLRWPERHTRRGTVHERVETMTYYEELGVCENASREEIRQAYKHLARLVHPDQCGDEETRRLADLQMKRLNGMAGVLLDPAGRERYDHSLMSLAAAVAGEPFPGSAPAWEWRRLVTAATAMMAVLLTLIVGASELRPMNPTSYVPLPAGAMAPAHATQPVSHGKMRAPKPIQTASTEEWEPLATYAYESHLAIPPVPFADVPAPPKSTREAPTRVAATLAGDWFYVPASQPAGAAYPPEYIELRLREGQGILHGSYKARYRVLDRAISPAVAFQFEGPMGADGGSLPWTGPGGSKGQVKLRILSGGDLEVNWEAEELGKELGLISGTATLVRRQD
jgi:hypothetical protein